MADRSIRLPLPAVREGYHHLWPGSRTDEQSFRSREPAGPLRTTPTTKAVAVRRAALTRVRIRLKTSILQGTVPAVFRNLDEPATTTLPLIKPGAKPHSEAVLSGRSASQTARGSGTDGGWRGSTLAECRARKSWSAACPVSFRAPARIVCKLLPHYGSPPASSYAPTRADEPPLAPQTKVRLTVIQWAPIKGTYEQWPALGGEFVVSRSGTLTLTIIGTIAVGNQDNVALASDVARRLQEKSALSPSSTPP